MRLLKFNKKENQWEQIFTDATLDRFKNLSDLENAEKARENLEINKYYWDKDELENGTALNGISPVCINEDKDNRFVTDEEKAFWNNKVDKPIINPETPPIDEITEGQIIYDPNEDRAQIRLNGKLQSLKLGTIRGAITGVANFAGQGNEVEVIHGAQKADGVPVTPTNAVFNPLSNTFGQLGETWVHFDNEKAYFGNTGRYTGKFAYTIFY